jgi:hypothetical protein
MSFMQMWIFTDGLCVLITSRYALSCFSLLILSFGCIVLLGCILKCEFCFYCVRFCTYCCLVSLFVSFIFLMVELFAVVLIFCLKCEWCCWCLCTILIFH